MVTFYVSCFVALTLNHIPASDVRIFSLKQEQFVINMCISCILYWLSIIADSLIFWDLGLLCYSFCMPRADLTLYTLFYNVP